MWPPPFFAWDAFYTAAIVLLCFGIYGTTRELYELTRHKGIEYFRKAFLFFGLSYLANFLFSLLLAAILPEMQPFRPLPIHLFMILPMGYFSTVAVFYLVLGPIWKRIDSRLFTIISHACAAALSLISFLAHAQFLMIFLQSALLVISLFLGTGSYAKGKIAGMRVIYEIVFISWLVNLLITEPQFRMPFQAKLVAQLLSLLLFVYIYSRIRKVAKG